MLDIGWSEMLMIAGVAIVVIGPKELPRALRTVGQWVSKARAMTRELQTSVNDMIAETELDDLRKSANSISNFSDDFSGASTVMPPPPPTPMKWPPDEDAASIEPPDLEPDDDDDFDASDEELAEWEADNPVHRSSDQDETPTVEANVEERADKNNSDA
ncbi:MAG: Sec-independent protein translocase protein TatB [Alphaproteobacteria bacterium]|nr:Sec-independent protein translocase protein TatB [Alphaproteobacteria bacterium]